MKRLTKTGVAIAATASLLGGCSAPQSVEDATRTSGVAIETESLLDSTGECLGRTDTVSLRIGEMAVLGEYAYGDGGWRLEVVSGDEIILTETAHYADTRIPAKVNEGESLSDIDMDSPVWLNIPPEQEEVNLAEYGLKEGGFFRSGGSDYRDGEAGVINARRHEDNEGFDIEITSRFREDIGRYCED